MKWTEWLHMFLACGVPFSLTVVAVYYFNDVDNPNIAYRVINRFNPFNFNKVIDKEEEEDGGAYFSSLLAMKQLALKEQAIIVEMVNILRQVRKGQKGRRSQQMVVRNVERYIKDYDESIRPMLFKKMKTSLNLSPKMYFKWPAIFKKTVEEDQLALAEIVSSHPMISFRMLRRILIDLPKIIETRWKLVFEAAHLKIKPRVSKDDLTGAAEGILRIQDTFNISAFDLSKGKLMDFETRSGLKAIDVHFIGKTALEDSAYWKAIDWLQRALRMTRKENDKTACAQIIKKQLLETIDKHNNLFQYSGNQDATFAEIVEKDLENWKTPRQNTFSQSDLTRFRALCRGENLRDANTTKNLKCWYERDNPYLLIKPLKTEQHSENPFILQYYEVLSNNVMNHLKNISATKLKRARVLANANDKADTILSKTRISSNAWFNEFGDEKLIRIPKVIKEATGLNAYTGNAAEESQVSVYGPVGGFYAYHYDNLFFPSYKQFSVLSARDIFLEDRIATFMIYLSDIEQGGGTAFPKIGVVSQAVKGSAMFWFNVKKNGELDGLTMHGGCSLLYGEKWILNKWIRGGEQMFIRKCSTNIKE